MLEAVLSNVLLLLEAACDLVFIQGLGDHKSGAHSNVKEPGPLGSKNRRGNQTALGALPAARASVAKRAAPEASSRRPLTHRLRRCQDRFQKLAAKNRYTWDVFGGFAVLSRRRGWRPPAKQTSLTQSQPS